MIWFDRFSARVDGVAPEALRCLDSAWGGDPGERCGLNAMNCKPFETETWSTFMCGECSTKDDWDTVVGGLDGKYHPMSRLCMSAVHAGVIMRKGGCGEWRLAGEVKRFGNGTSHNGVTSLPFDSPFPSSVEYRSVDATRISGACVRKPLAASIGALLFLYLAASALWVSYSTKLVLFFLPVICSCFYFPLVANPTVPLRDLHLAFSNVILVLVSAFCLFSAASNTTLAALVDENLLPQPEDYVFLADHEGSNSAVSRRIRFNRMAAYLLFLVPFFCTLHMNYFTRILPDIDISSSSLDGGLTAGAIGLLVAEGAIVLFFLTMQIRSVVKKEGALKRYLLGYISFVAAVLVSCAMLSSEYGFHLHHSFIAGALWPLSCFDTKFSIFFQGALLGIFMNGILEWGWGGDIWDYHGTGSGLPDEELHMLNATRVTSNAVSLSWNPPARVSDKITSTAVLMNGIEIHRTVNATGSLFTAEQLIQDATYFFQVVYVYAQGLRGENSGLVFVHTLTSSE